MKALVEQILENQGLLKDEIQMALRELSSQNDLVMDAVAENQDHLMKHQLDIMNAIKAINDGITTTSTPALKQINTEQLEFEETDANFIGIGGFGTVYKGKYFGHKVAVKKMNAGKITREQRDELKNEALIMQVIFVFLAGERTTEFTTMFLRSLVSALGLRSLCLSFFR
jgi:hypothetical protein